MNNRPDKFSKSMMNIPPSGIRKFFEMLIGHDDVISGREWELGEIGNNR